MKTTTGFPVCTERGCRCEGDMPITSTLDPKYIGRYGHAVCQCHSVATAKAHRVERFDCGKEATA